MARLMEPFIKAVYIKDFAGKKPNNNDKDWSANGVPWAKG